MYCSPSLSGQVAAAAIPGAGMLQVGQVVGPDDVLEDDCVVDVVVDVVVVVIKTGGLEVEDAVTVVLNAVDDAPGGGVVDDGQF